MAKPFTALQSRFQFPVAVANPIAVIWNDTTIVLAINDERLKDIVFIYESGKWIKKKTTGIVPGNMYYHDYTAQVIEDKLYVYVVGHPYFNLRFIYCLNLRNWNWTEMTPPELFHCNGLSSWVYKGKIYYLDQRLYTYNDSKNTWEFPQVRGEIPLLTDDAKTIINDDTVFLFYGGCTNGYNEYASGNNLYTLNMETMIWTKVHGNVSTMEFLHIANDMNLTLTKISQYSAILLGESGNSMVGWLLDLQNAKQLREPSALWTKIPLCSLIIKNYAAVLEPQRQELLLIGGEILGSNTSNVLRIPTRLPSLQSLAIACAAQMTCFSDPKPLLHKLPLKLRNEIQAYQEEVIGQEIP